MSVNYAGKKVTGFPGLYVKAKDKISDAVIAFDTVVSAPTTTTGKYFLYVAADGSLAFNNGSVITTIGASGSVSSGTWDGIYAADKTLTIGNGTMTFAGNSSTSANVVTFTNIAGSSGAAIQITNDTTSNPDIKGTGDVWQVLGTGAATFLSVTLSGNAGSTVQTITAGDVVYSDGSLAITDADNAATFSVTNNTATTASVVVLAGSGVFTGNTTSSWMTLTPSGLTTGTALYLPVAALTTGKALHIVANAATDGLVVNVTSSSVVLTSTGRLLNISHSGNATVSGVIAEVSSAAADESVIFKVTASGVLALGTALAVSGSSITTGNGITVADLDSLTDGYGIQVASAATAITSTGHLLYVNHTGATTTSGVLSEFKSAATDETIVVKINTAAMVNGIALNIVGTTGMTSGSLIRATSSTAGAVATNGVYSFVGTGDFTVGAVGLGMFHVANNTTTAGTIASFSGTALTTGVLMYLASTDTGMTSGSLFRATTGTTGAVATNGVVSIRATGAYTSTSNAGLLDVQASATTAGTLVNIKSTAAGQTAATLLNVAASGYTTGYTGNVVLVTGCSTTGASNTISVVGVNTTAGNVVNITNNALTLGAGTLLNLNHTTSVLGAGSSMVRISSTGIDTGTTTGVLLDLSSTAGAVATQVLATFSALTSGKGILVSTAALTTNGIAIGVDMTAATAGQALNLVTTGAYTGTGMALITVGAMTTGVGLSVVSTTGLTSGSLIRATTSTAGAIATNGAISFTATGNFTNSGLIGFMHVGANSTTSGTVATMSATALTDGNILVLSATEATLTTGKYLQCYDGAAADFSIAKYGATVIAGNAQGTAALTLTAGDIVVTAGNVTFGGQVVFSGTEDITAGGTTTALSLNKSQHTIACDAGGDTFTLANGTNGQVMTILCKAVNGGTCTITPATFAQGTSITFNAIGDAVMLQYATTTGWFIIGGNSYAIV